MNISERKTINYLNSTGYICFSIIFQHTSLLSNRSKTADCDKRYKSFTNQLKLCSLIFLYSSIELCKNCLY